MSGVRISSLGNLPDYQIDSPNIFQDPSFPAGYNPMDPTFGVEVWEEQYQTPDYLPWILAGILLVVLLSKGKKGE